MKEVTNNIFFEDFVKKQTKKQTDPFYLKELLLYSVIFIIVKIITDVIH